VSTSSRARDADFFLSINDLGNITRGNSSRPVAHLRACSSVGL